MKVLVIAPHPDDEVLGCGATIKKLSDKGHKVNLMVITKAYEPDWSKEMLESRPKKVKESCRLLGISEVQFLNFDTAKIDLIPIKDLSKKIFEASKALAPEMVFIPFWGDAHQDHQTVSKAAIVAFRPVSSKVKEILAYEVLSETEWGIEGFKPTIYSVVSRAELECKKQAMGAYFDELKKAPHPRSLEIIEALAKKRGSEVLSDYAEAFVSVRRFL